MQIPLAAVAALCFTASAQTLNVEWILQEAADQFGNSYVVAPALRDRTHP